MSTSLIKTLNAVCKVLPLIRRVSNVIGHTQFQKKAIKKASQLTGLVGLTVIGKTGFEPATPTSRT